MKKPIIISSLFLGTLLAGCNAPPPPSKPIPRPPGYRCVAANHKTGGHSAITWSTNKHVAQTHALKKCRLRSLHPAACQIKTCIHTGLPSSKYWYTCYVKNRSVGGLWSGTSHSRFTSVSRAFDRCRRLSGKPASCYFQYCRVW
ncbi:hypothetical protein [Candidiatus Paracoxiella cheracis]|uniref:hypothetical protein n=1 Tax=Candidiatus Paracoxiella cheracis TaxID=3405120 RepID=UPI003BF46462